MFYFKQWATQNGFLYKSEQNWYNTMQFEQVGQKRQELKLELSINTDFRYLPYMDTFKFLDAKTGKLYNYQYDSRHLRTLCSSEGSSYEGDYLRFDGLDRVLRYQGDSAWVDYKEFYTHYNNITWSEVNGQYILNEHVEYCNEIGEPIFNSKYDHLNNHELIEKRKKEIEEWNKKRPKKLSGLSVEQLLEKNLISQEDIEEIFGNINSHRTSNQNQ
jgi:hypothetical protein